MARRDWAAGNSPPCAVRHQRVLYRVLPQVGQGIRLYAGPQEGHVQRTIVPLLLHAEPVLGRVGQGYALTIRFGQVRPAQGRHLLAIEQVTADRAKGDLVARLQMRTLPVRTNGQRKTHAQVRDAKLRVADLTPVHAQAELDARHALADCDVQLQPGIMDLARPAEGTHVRAVVHPL